MGSGCVLAAGASRAGTQAPQEGLQGNLSVAAGRKQLQNAMGTYLVWVSFRQTALPGKNAHRDRREQLELHSMVWTGTARAEHCSEHSPPPVVAAGPNTVHTEDNQQSRDRLRLESDLALCLSMQLPSTGCASSQHPTITQLSMTHK